MTENNDFIEIYNNSASQKLCDELIKWFDLCSDKKFTEHNMSFKNNPATASLRSDEAMSIPRGVKPDFPVSSSSVPIETCNAYWDVLNKSLANYISKYDMQDIGLACYNFKIQKVKERQGYHVWHFENDHTVHSYQRVLAWMTYLKAPEEGGETEFLYQSKRIKPEIGTTLIWPAYFTHLHRGNPPLKGEKYYITGWFEVEAK